MLLQRDSGGNALGELSMCAVAVLVAFIEQHACFPVTPSTPIVFRRRTASQPAAGPTAAAFMTDLTALREESVPELCQSLRFCKLRSQSKIAALIEQPTDLGVASSMRSRALSRPLSFAFSPSLSHSGSTKTDVLVEIGALLLLMRSFITIVAS